jgi:ADP-ribose pyrophosphatase YjhB (NUDIX family)/predicted transcriptional regulator
MSEVLHRAQVSVLHDLRYKSVARFNELKHSTSLESDSFKFHLRKLVSSGYIQKTAEGGYMLTAKGKEFSNVLNEQKRSLKKQPKLSVMLLVTRQRKGQKEYLVYKRAMHPFWGYWTAMSEAVLWGESFGAAASRRLKRQSGYEADFSFNSLVRAKNLTDSTDEPAEDVVFVVMEANNLHGEPHADYTGGVPAWLTLPELIKQERFFSSLPAIITNAETARQTLEIDTLYTDEDF